MEAIYFYTDFKWTRDSERSFFWLCSSFKECVVIAPSRYMGEQNSEKIYIYSAVKWVCGE
jgi:hypothetical protein